MATAYPRVTTIFCILILGVSSYPGVFAVGPTVSVAVSQTGVGADLRIGVGDQSLNIGVGGPDAVTGLDQIQERLCSSQDESVTVSVTKDSVNGKAAVKLVYNLNESVSALTVTSISSVTDTTGFSTYGTNSGSGLYVWNSSVENPSLTVSLTSLTFPSYEAENWAFGKTPSLVTTWSAGGSIHCRETFTDDPSSAVTAPTTLVYERGLLYVGDSGSTQTREIGENTTMTVLTPPQTHMMSGSVSDLVSQYDTVARRFDVGCNKDVLLVVSRMPMAGAASGVTSWAPGDGSSIWVKSSRDVKAIDQNAYLHEFVHSRMCYAAPKEMNWFVEGSAEYLATMYAHDLYGNEPAMRKQTRVRFSGNLSNPDSWSTSFVAYDEGRAAVAALDYRLRTRGDHTIVDLIRWMNQHPGVVTYEEFRGKVVDWTDEETGEWLDHVTTDGTASLLRSQERALVSAYDSTEEGETRETDDYSEYGPPRGGS